MLLREAKLPSGLSASRHKQRDPREFPYPALGCWGDWERKGALRVKRLAREPGHAERQAKSLLRIITTEAVSDPGKRP